MRRNSFGWVRFLVFCFLYKINLNPRKNICCGKKWPQNYEKTSWWVSRWGYCCCCCSCSLLSASRLVFLKCSLKVAKSLFEITLARRLLLLLYFSGLCFLLLLSIAIQTIPGTKIAKGCDAMICPTAAFLNVLLVVNCLRGTAVPSVKSLKLVDFRGNNSYMYNCFNMCVSCR